MLLVTNSDTLYIIQMHEMKLLLIIISHYKYKEQNYTVITCDVISIISIIIQHIYVYKYNKLRNQFLMLYMKRKF